MKQRADTSVGGASKWRAWVVLSVLLLTVILVPFFLFEQDMNAWVDRVLRTSVPGEGAAAAVISLLALDVFLPIPSSIVSTAAGAMLGFALGVAASTAGMTLGCFLAHFCGRRFGSPLMRRIVRDRDLEEVAEQFRRGAIWALATLRPVPVLAEASALFAGVSGVPLSKYMGVTTLANAGISAVYCAVGANALESGSFLLAFAGSIALPAAAMLISRWVHRRR